jgi:periplasmic glucans biosynthesis protein
VSHYRDYEAEYHRRPSVWIKPHQPWGAGAVELLELPTEVEWMDNIAACWVPAEPLRAGETRSLAYQVAFASAAPGEHGGGRFVATHMNRRAAGAVEFTLDIDGMALAALPAGAALQPVVTTNRGRIADAICAKNPDGIWQLRFRLERFGERPCELRGYVRQGGDILTETWSFLYP